MPFSLERTSLNCGSFLYGYSSKGARDVATYEVATGQTITRGMFVALNAQDKAVVATDAASITFKGIAVAKPVNRKGKQYVRVFQKGFFKITATSIGANNALEGAQMYVKTSTTFDDTSVNAVKCGRLVKWLSATKGWIELNVDAE
jgi:hypothetical protein